MDQGVPLLRQVPMVHLSGGMQSTGRSTDTDTDTGTDTGTGKGKSARDLSSVAIGDAGPR